MPFCDWRCCHRILQFSSVCVCLLKQIPTSLNLEHCQPAFSAGHIKAGISLINIHTTLLQSPLNVAVMGITCRQQTHRCKRESAPPFPQCWQGSTCSPCASCTPDPTLGAAHGAGSIVVQVTASPASLPVAASGDRVQPSGASVDAMVWGQSQQ